MLSDIEYLDITLGENHFDTVEREESSNSNLATRPESANSNNFENDDENMYLSSGVINLGINNNFCRNSTSANSGAEIKRLSSELNSRISREMNEMMNSVSVQIQRAINDTSITSGIDSSSSAFSSTSVSSSDSTSSVVVCMGVDSSSLGATYFSSFDDSIIFTHLLEGPALSSVIGLGFVGSSFLA